MANSQHDDEWGCRTVGPSDWDCVVLPDESLAVTEEAIAIAWILVLTYENFHLVVVAGSMIGTAGGMENHCCWSCDGSCRRTLVIVPWLPCLLGEG